VNNIRKFRVYLTEENFKNNIFIDYEVYKIIEIIEREIQAVPDQGIWDFIAQNGGCTRRFRDLINMSNVKTVKELLQLSWRDLIKYRNVGRTTMVQLETMLGKHNLKLSEDWKRG
jgi:hypothetical protein